MKEECKQKEWGKITKRCLGTSINACVFGRSWLAYVGDT